MRRSIWKRKGYFWVTLLLFLMAVAVHWAFAWKAYVQECAEHFTTPQFNDYFVDVMRDTFENWQSEFLQLIWQVVGLSFLWYAGSPDSKEGDERKEAKLDFIIRNLDPEKGAMLISDLEKKYPKK